MSAGRVLATGGAGYIGAHVTLHLLRSGFEVVVLDNLATGSREALRRVAAMAGRQPRLIVGDLRDASALDAAFASGVDSVIHMAGLKSVADSALRPEDYYAVNVGGTAELLSAMRRHGTQRLAFSSSAVVYGLRDDAAIGEDAPMAPTSPYGRTKMVAEMLIDDMTAAEPGLRAISLRYFNPAGAEPGGRIGEDPTAGGGNLFPSIARALLCGAGALSVFGSDYPTRDGTGVRDFVHVSDLARAHVAALAALARPDAAAHERVNLGNGRGSSVLEVAQAFREVVGRDAPVRMAPRRPGDVAVSVADPSRAAALLGWRAELGLRRMCEDHWRWCVDNPRGYASADCPAAALDRAASTAGATAARL